MKEYPKICGPYRRHTEGPFRNRIIIGDWLDPIFEYLADYRWIFTEKVDGTNVRVHWNGHRATFGGRTDRAQLPTKLLQVLQEMFPEELMEQTFEATEVTLYGEGYGKGIQKGGVYRDSMSFVLFDVLIDKWWLEREALEDVAGKLGIDLVPIMKIGTLYDGIDLVSCGLTSYWDDDCEAEGLVGIPELGLLDRSGKRIMVKIKAKDFREVTQ